MACNSAGIGEGERHRGVSSRGERQCGTAAANSSDLSPFSICATSRGVLEDLGERLLHAVLGLDRVTDWPRAIASSALWRIHARASIFARSTPTRMTR
jgi:hypothetical protein